MTQTLHIEYSIYRCGVRAFIDEVRIGKEWHIVKIRTIKDNSIYRE